MQLQDLVGKHYLSGIDYGQEKYDNYGVEDDRQCIIFILDDIKYIASEDPEDGYRSCMKELEITEERISNIFESVEVLCKMKEDGAYETNDILEIYDAENGLLILSIGTGNTDDYYPYFEFDYNPENMSVNMF